MGSIGHGVQKFLTLCDFKRVKKSVFGHKLMLKFFLTYNLYGYNEDNYYV
jgi:hypothetical protein